MDAILSAVCDQCGAVVQEWAEYADCNLCLTCDLEIPLVYPDEDELPPPSGSWFDPDLGSGE